MGIKSTQSVNESHFVWLVPRKRSSHYAIALSEWVSEWVSVIRVLIVFPDYDPTPWSVYFGL